MNGKLQQSLRVVRAGQDPEIGNKIHQLNHTCPAQALPLSLITLSLPLPSPEKKKPDRRLNHTLQLH